MKFIHSSLWWLAFAFSQAWAQEAPPPTDVSARIDQSVKSFSGKIEKFQKEMAAMPPDQRAMAARIMMPDASATVTELIEIIKSHPEHPSVPDAFGAVMQISRMARRPVDISPAYEAILTHHLANEKTGMTCLLAAFDQANAKKAREFLDAVMAKSPSETLQGIAAFGLAQKATEEPKKISLLEAAVAKMGDFRLPDGRPLKPMVEGELRSLKFLAVGKEAPEIEGEDLTGNKLKLSDFRGKVVLLDFWGHWCGPCRATYPHSRSLVEKLKDKPFVMIGVNSDPKERIEPAVKDGSVTWRFFWDGGGPDGPIATAWGVQSWPTIYVLDGKGVIRYKNIRGAELDAAIEALLAEAGKN